MQLGPPLPLSCVRPARERAPRVLRAGYLLAVWVLAACGAPVTASTPGDYAVARRQFRTRLIRQGPSPQAALPYTMPSDALPISYESDGLHLQGWVSRASGEGLHPAVLFVHGGAAFGVEDWEMTRPFRDAGFVVMTPVLRSENGQAGFYSLFYDEVDDVLAAAKVLARQPGVDAGRVYLAGHSAGGTIALLAAAASSQFRAAASFSADPDFESFSRLPGVNAPYAPADPSELRMRSALVFATSFKCPTRMFWGDQEAAVGEANLATVRRARAAGLDVAGLQVTGDHHTMLGPAIAAAIAFFSQPR